MYDTYISHCMLK